MVAGKPPTIAFPKRVSVRQAADYKTIAKTLSNTSRRRVAPTPNNNYWDKGRGMMNDELES